MLPRPVIVVELVLIRHARYDRLLRATRHDLSHLLLLLLLAFEYDGWHLHREREGAALHLSRSEPDLARVAVAQVLADDEAKTNALSVHLFDVFELAKLLE